MTLLDIEPQQRADFDALIEESMSFAQSQLEKYGEFYPFTRVLRRGGAIESVATYTGTEYPKSNDLIAALNKVLRHMASSETLLATAMFRDITLRDESGYAGNAVAADLEHRGGHCLTIAFPYTRTDDGVQFEDPIVQAHAGVVFGGVV